MAQLKDTIVSGNLRVTDTTLTDTLQVTIIKAPTSSGGTTYGPGTDGQVLKSNGSSVYWTSDSNTDEKVKSTKLAQSTAETSYYPTLVTGAGTAGVSIFDSAKINHTPGTTSVVGNTRLILGNATNEGTANNEEGLLRIYSSGTKYHTLQFAKITNDHITHIFPTTGGTILNTGTTSVTAVYGSTGTHIATVKVNGSDTKIYAPTNTDEKVKVDLFTSTTATDYMIAGATAAMATTAGHLVIDTADGVASARIRLQKGTTSAVGQAMLMLGNNLASGTAKNMQGSILMYTSTANYGKITPAALTDTRTWTMPDKTGTIALTSDIPTVNNASLTLKGAGTTVTTFTANASTNQSLDIVAGTNVTITPDATNHKITIASSYTNTDTKVTQSETTTNQYRPIVFGATNSTDTSTLAATITDQTYVSTLLYAQPQNGILYANRMYLKAPGSKGQLNLLTSKYNVMLRNDDSNTYFLVTAQNDPTGTWTSARPLTINNSTGVCDINGNAATAGNANNANVTVTDVPSTSTSTDPWKASYGILFAQNPNTTQSNTLRKSHNLRFYHSRNGTADTVGIGELIIGNNTASGTAGNMQGRLTLYSSSSSCISMVPTATSSAVTLTLPAVTGTVPSFTATPTSGQVVVTDGTAGGVKSSGYTIATSVPSGAKFTDANLTQTAVGSTYTNYRPIVISDANSATEGFSPSTTTGGSYITSSLYCQPSTGMLHANIFKAGKASTTDGEIKFYRSGGSGETTLKATAQSTSGTYLLPDCGNGTYTLSIGMTQVGGTGDSLVMSNVSGIPQGTRSFKIVFKSNASLPIYSMVEIPNIGDGVDCGGLIQVGDYTDGQQGSLRIVMKGVVVRVTAGTTAGTKTFTATVTPTTKINSSDVSNINRNVIMWKIYACC